MAGDGTTSVVVLCGALLKKALELLERGIHPTVVSDSFSMAVAKAVEARPLLLTYGHLHAPATSWTLHQDCRRVGW